MQVHQGTPGTTRRPPNPTNEKLPRAARAKLLALMGAAADARDASSSAQARLSDLQTQRNSGALPPEREDAVAQEVERLQSVRAKQNERHRALLALVGNLNHYVQALPRDISLEMVKHASPQVQKGERLTDALDRVRDQITALKNRRRAVAGAELPNAARKEAMRAWVQEQARLGAPDIAIKDGKFEVTYGTVKSFVPQSVKGAAQLFAWIDPEAFTKRLEDAIDAMPEPANVMSADERERRILVLNSDLEHCERDEESLIEHAADEGTEFLRRPEASPAAVLGVRVKQRARIRAT